MNFSTNLTRNQIRVFDAFLTSSPSFHSFLQCKWYCVFDIEKRNRKFQEKRKQQAKMQKLEILKYIGFFTPPLPRHLDKVVLINKLKIDRIFFNSEIY